MYVKAVFMSGHMGSGKYHEMVRYLKVKDMAEVFRITRQMPRVKKKAAALISCKEITREEYFRGKEEEKMDPYLNTVNA